MKSVSRFPTYALIVAALLLVHGSVRADQVDEFVRSHLAERHIPGAAVAVIQKGRVVKMKGYGLASLEYNVPVTTETVFEVGSVSKQMTAAAIMLLVEDGKVSLDERISRYLPGTPDAWRDVTVRHLLTHTSGIKSYSSLDGFALLRRLKVEDFIKQLAPHPLDFLPGEKNIYSNSGFNLLAFIIEAQSGKPYMDFMRERIFRPLGMTKTGDRDPQFIISNRATGYEWQDGRHTGRDWDLTDLKGAGSIVSTIDDLTKWNAGLSGNSFLKPSSKAELWKQFTFNDGKLSPYGFGWRISDFRGHKLVGHTGQTAGFGAANYRYVDNDLTVAVLTNLGDIGLGGTMAVRIAKFYIPAISLEAMKEKPETGPAFAAKVRTVLQNRIEDKLDSEWLSGELIRSLSTDRSKAVARRVALFGNPKRVVFVGAQDDGVRTVYRYKAETAKRTFLWRIALDGEGKITELALEEEE